MPSKFESYHTVDPRTDVWLSYYFLKIKTVILKDRTYYNEALNDVFSRLLMIYLILSAVVGSFWKSNRTLCKCIAAPGAWETNLNSLKIIIPLCHKVNANRNKAFCIIVINHCQMGDLIWSVYLIWTFADVTDSSNNINEKKIWRVLVYTDLPSTHQNSSPKPVRKKNADFN